MIYIMHASECMLGAHTHMPSASSELGSNDVGTPESDYVEQSFGFHLETYGRYDSWWILLDSFNC